MSIHVTVPNGRKFARYFEVSPRIIPVSEESDYCLDLKKIRENLDENTIGTFRIAQFLTAGIFVILGSTYTGHYEPVEEDAKLLDEFEKETGIDIPIHVDGASGAFFCPFATPSVKFGFSISRVKSINTYVTQKMCLMIVPDTSTVSFILVSVGLFGEMRRSSPTISNLNCTTLEVQL